MVVVITGGSSGIGLESSKLYASKGHKVYSLNRRPLDIENVNYIKCDISDSDQIESAIKEIVSREKRIDILVNNAGMGISGAIETHNEEDIKRILDINLLGLINVTRISLPYLRESKGMVVNISSVAGPISIPYQTMYSVTKSAVLAFSTGLRNEVRPFKVRVTSVLPGDTKTGFTDARKKNSDDSVYSSRVNKSVERMEKDETNGVPASKVAKKIYKVSLKKNPNTYYVVGTSYRLLVYLSRVLPKRFVNWLIFKIYG